MANGQGSIILLLMIRGATSVCPQTMSRILQTNVKLHLFHKNNMNYWQNKGGLMIFLHHRFGEFKEKSELEYTEL